MIPSTKRIFGSIECQVPPVIDGRGIRGMIAVVDSGEMESILIGSFEKALVDLIIGLVLFGGGLGSDAPGASGREGLPFVHFK